MLFFVLSLGVIEKIFSLPLESDERNLIWYLFSSFYRSWSHVPFNFRPKRGSWSNEAIIQWRNSTSRRNSTLIMPRQSRENEWCYFWIASNVLSIQGNVLSLFSRFSDICWCSQECILLFQSFLASSYQFDSFLFLYVIFSILMKHSFSIDFFFLLNLYIKGLENVLNGRVPILLDDESFPPLLVEYYALFCDALLKPAQREKFEKAETWGTEVVCSIIFFAVYSYTKEANEYTLPGRSWFFSFFSSPLLAFLCFLIFFRRRTHSLLVSVLPLSDDTVLFRHVSYFSSLL